MRSLVVLALASQGCRFDFNVVAEGGPPPGYFTIGGVASGLNGAGLTIQNNGGDDLHVAGNEPFVFSTPLADQQAYAVTIAASPAGEACLVANGAGAVASAAVTDVAVTCFPAGSCPSTSIMFTTSGTFTLPAGCTAMTVSAFGGGGAGGAKHLGTAAAGGAGGAAVRTLTNQLPGTLYTIAIGLGGVCDSKVATAGGYAGGGGGNAGGSGNGVNGAGTMAPPGGIGGAGSIGTQPGGAGGEGGYGGGGGGGGGDVAAGNSAGAATVFARAGTDYVVAGGGGAAGAADQNGDVAGGGGAACAGYVGADGVAAIAGLRSAGGGGGGACYCLNGCDVVPSSSGGAGGDAGTASGCTVAENGAPGWIAIAFP